MKYLSIGYNSLGVFADASKYMLLIKAFDEISNGEHYDTNFMYYGLGYLLFSFISFIAKRNSNIQIINHIDTVTDNIATRVDEEIDKIKYSVKSDNLPE